MKYIYLLLLTLIMFACGGTDPEEKNGSVDIESLDLAGLKAELNSKKSELSEINATVKKIEMRIAELDPASLQKEVKKVTVLPIEKGEFKHFITVQGLLMPNDIIAINSETSGRILTLKIDEGDYVKEGDLVAELDTESIDKQRAEIEKSYELAKEVYERRKRLWGQNIGSEIEYLQSKNEVERIEKMLATLEFQKSKGKIFAPISGIVDVINVHQGELVSPGIPIANILDVRQLVATADVPEIYLSSVKVGDKVKLNFPSLNYKVDGRVNLIGNTIDAANRTFKIEVKVARTNKNLKPNLLTEIEINDQTIEDVIAIPVNSVMQEVSGKEYVMVVNRSQNQAVAEKRYVKRGAFNNEVVVIESGLDAGQELVNIGARNLVNKDPIEIIVPNFESGNK